ncbi:MAG: nitroreductase family protein [Spirochaetes bacterium]|nr:nitroreductase family protein [Spirochaetota bacterium]
MSLFSVDDSLCTRCGACIAECPVVIIEGRDGFPVPVSKADELCVRCGHCVAVCPHGALDHENMSAAQCPPVLKELAVTEAQVSQFFRSRRSIRNYRDRAVDRTTLTRLIETARYAPTGHNSQLVRWLVVYDTAEVRRLSGLVADWMRFMIKEQPAMAAEFHWDLLVRQWDGGMDRICRGAPHVIVAHAPKDNPMSQGSCTIAMAYLELTAMSMGLGACWAGYFDIAARFWPPMTEALALPEGHGNFGSMMVGYPTYRYHRIPLRNDPDIIFR